MSDGLPPGPAPIPAPDRHQIERLNALYNLGAPGLRGDWIGRASNLLFRVAARLLTRQQAFNAVLVDHINRNDRVGIEAHEASARTIVWLQERLDLHADEIRRHQEALAAWEARSNAAISSLAASHDELRTSIGALQQTMHALQRDLARRPQEDVARPQAAAESGPGSSGALAPEPAGHSLLGHAYVGFEDRFRGAPEEIRTRLEGYLPIFEGAQDVLDVGCGRGEFLALLRDRGVRARGIDLNPAMVDVCRTGGLDAEHADALGYLRAQPDASLGGIFAAQVIEHLEPAYLTSLLGAALDKLRPGAPIVLETINPACWFAFFESYIRDLTHVRPVHPDTLKYLLVATGFLRVEIEYRSPYPEPDKLQPVAPHVALGDWAETINANVAHLNRLLFTCLDYAAVGRRP